MLLQVSVLYAYKFDQILLITRLELLELILEVKDIVLHFALHICVEINLSSKLKRTEEKTK